MPIGTLYAMETHLREVTVEDVRTMRGGPHPCADDLLCIYDAAHRKVFAQPGIGGTGQN